MGDIGAALKNVFIVSFNPMFGDTAAEELVPSYFLLHHKRFLKDEKNCIGRFYVMEGKSRFSIAKPGL